MAHNLTCSENLVLQSTQNGYSLSKGKLRNLFSWGQNLHADIEPNCVESFEYFFSQCTYDPIVSDFHCCSMLGHHSFAQFILFYFFCALWSKGSVVFSFCLFVV